MARNRKRAKDRRTRRPTPDPGSGRGVATARGGRGPTPDLGPSPDVDHAPEDVDTAAPGVDHAAPGPVEPEPDEALEPATPGAIEHASPDVELAEAQLALGRAEAAGKPPPAYREQDADADADAGDEFDETFEADTGSGDSSEGFSDGGGSGRPPRGGELVHSGGGAPAPRSLPGGRLVNFLQGSWRELQRVQWPDRRQVMQATGVVIGFVIVAGVFLGLADLIATKVVNFVLK